MKQLRNRAIILVIALLVMLYSLPVQQLHVMVAQSRIDTTHVETGKDAATQKVDKVRERTEKRTAYSKTWVNSDLSETVEVFNTPIHFATEDANNQRVWKEIDNTIVDATQDSQEKGKFAFKNTENQFQAFFASQANKEIFKIKQGTYWLSYAVDGANATSGEADSYQVTYKDFFPGTDAVYAVRGDGVKEDIIFHRPPPFTTLRYTLHTNLDVSQQGQTVQFTDRASGAVVWTFAPPFLRDANDKESYNVSYTLTKNQGKVQLVVQLDTTFLQDPATAYPVKLDPTVVAGGDTASTFDAYVGEYYSNVNYGMDDELRTGYAPGVYSHRSYIKFGTSLPSLNGGLLTSAVFKAYKYYEPASVDTTINIMRPTAAWTSSGIKWNNQPTVSSTIYASKAFPSGAANAWYAWNVTNLTNFWYENPSQYVGLMMQAANENTSGSYRKFYSSDYNGGLYAPRLEITYAPKPDAPIGAAYGYGENSTTGYVNLSWDAVAGATGYKVSLFNGKNYEDIDVGNRTSWSTQGKKLWPTKEQVLANPSPTTNTNWISISNGSDVGTGQELPDDPGYLYQATGGGYGAVNQYYFRVKAYNSLGETASSNAFTPTIVDQTAPSVPSQLTVKDTKYDTYTLTWSPSQDTGSGVRGYYVFIGSATGKVDVMNGAFTTTPSYTVTGVALTPRKTYYTFIKAVDQEGNYANSSSVSATARRQVDATITSSSFPLLVKGNTAFSGSVTVKNEGIDAWTGTGYALKSVSTNDPLKQLSIFPLGATETIAPGQSKTFSLPYASGTTAAGVYAIQWEMAKNNSVFGDVASTTTEVDLIPPAGAIAINQGANFTYNRQVTLSLQATDNTPYPLRQQIKNENQTWTSIALEPFSSTKAWTLTAGDGRKTVSALFHDIAGNESPEYPASIVLDTVAPTISLTSPVAASLWDTTVTIEGAVSDANATTYTVSYAPVRLAQPGTYRPIEVSQAATNHVVNMQWDTSSLAPGDYAIKIEATDGAGNTSQQVRQVTVVEQWSYYGIESDWAMVDVPTGYESAQVNLANGNFFVQVTDATLAGRGLDVLLQRSYNSKDWTNVGLGTGWRLNVHAALQVTDEQKIVYTDEDGSRHMFQRQADGSYVPPAGVLKTLTKQSDGTYVVADQQNEGYTQSFNAAGQWTKSRDRNGNTIDFHYTGKRLTQMTDTVGRHIDFSYDQDLLQSIHLATGQTVTYSYDANQRLTRVQFVAANDTVYRTLRYNYDNRTEKISTIISPNGHAFNYMYKGSFLDQVVYTKTRYLVSGSTGATQVGTTPEQIIHDFNYALTDLQVTASTSTSNQAHDIVYTLNTDGNIVQTDSYTGDGSTGQKVTQKATYTNHRLTATIDGRGNETTYVYDARGNLIQQTLPPNGQTMTPVTTFTYQPGTSLLLSQTDASGRTTHYEYDERGNRTAVIDVDGFRQTFVYDAYGNVTSEKKDRGPLFAIVNNSSFEEGTTTPTGWMTTGAVTLHEAEPHTGKRSVFIPIGATVTTTVTVDTVAQAARAFAWLKATSGTGSASVTLRFNDEANASLAETTSSLQAISTAWSRQHAVFPVPTQAKQAVLTFTNTGDTPLLLDTVWLEVAAVKNTSTYTEATTTAADGKTMDGLYLVQTTDPSGQTTRYTYDSRGNTRTVTDPLQRTTTTVYSDDDQVISSKDELGHTVTTDYDANGNVKQTTTALGNVTVFTYDECNQHVNTTFAATMADVSSIGVQGGTAPNADHVNTEYDGFNRAIAVRDGVGNVTKYAYDGLDRVIAVQTPGTNGTVKRVETDYDANGNKVSEKNVVYPMDTSGNIVGQGVQQSATKYTYDASNRLLQLFNYQQGTYVVMDQYTYDISGNVTELASGEARHYYYAYDNQNRQTYSVDAMDQPNESWNVLDGNGNVAMVIDHNGVTTYRYDVNNRLVTLVEPGERTTTYTYDAVGNKVSQRDPAQMMTTWTYDRAGQVTTQVRELAHDADGTVTKKATTTYTYDADGQVLTREESEADNGTVVHATTVTSVYDYRGRVIRERTKVSDSPDIIEIQHAFNDNGAEVHTVRVTYTPGDNNTEKEVDGSRVETTYTYDEVGRLTSQTGDTSTATATYDDLQQQVIVTTPAGDATTTYDENDQVSEMTHSSSDASAPTSLTHTFTYDKDGNVSQQSSSVLEQAYKYDGGVKVNDIRITRVTTNQRTLLQQLSYTYDDAGRVAALQEGNQKRTYTYTEENTLGTVTSNGQTTAYTYDANTNLTQVTNATTGNVMETYTYTSDDRILTRQVGTNERYTYTYDAAGNVASIAQTTNGREVVNTTLTYNGLHQLVGVKKQPVGQAEVTLTYTYDDEGNRIGKVVQRGTSKDIYQYQLDENKAIVAETVAHKDVADATKDTPATTEIEYIRHANGSLLGLRYEKQDYEYVFNGRGDVIAITNDQGEIVVTYAYDEWGNVTSSTSSALAERNPYRYVGKYGVRYDQDTDLYFMTWRDYDPGSKRFIVPDTFEGFDDDSVSQNRYLYASGDPVNNIDPSGNFIESAFDAIMLAMSISAFMAKPNLINGIAVLLDGISLALPFVPGGAGLALRTMIKFTPDGIKYLKKIFGSGKAYRAVRSFISKYRCKLGTFANKKIGKQVFRQCFTAGTLISTADGLKAIEDIQVGDNVYAVDTETGEVGLKDVKQTFVRETDVLVHLTMEDESADEETITTTVEHPFWVKGIGWTSASELQAGQHVLQQDGTTTIVTDVDVEALQTPTKVYNFEVAAWHTYFVSDERVLVHNADYDDNVFTKHAAFRDAKRRAGIPNATQHKKPVYIYDSSTENRIVYEFQVDGKKKYVIEHREDKFGRGPHFHGAGDKMENPLKKGRYEQFDGHSPEHFNGYRR